MAACSTSSPILTALRPKQHLYSSPRCNLSASYLNFTHKRVAFRKPYYNPFPTLNRDSFKIPKSRPRSSLRVSAVFERFTERAIKAVVFSQREARALGRDMVFTQHLLLGLVAEDRAKNGFLGSGITIEKAREAVRKIWGGREEVEGDGPATDVPFSVSSKRVFEAAVEFSRQMGCSFISPEHIAIGLFTVDDGSAGQVLQR